MRCGHSRSHSSFLYFNSTSCLLYAEQKRSPELCAQLTVLINDFRTTRPDIAHDIRVDTPYAKVRGLLSDGPDLLRSFEKFLPKIEALSGEALEQEMTEHKQE